MTALTTHPALRMQVAGGKNFKRLSNLSHYADGSAVEYFDGDSPPIRSRYGQVSVTTHQDGKKP